MVYWLTVIGTACWAVCFYWMYRISAKQERLLVELRDQGKRIERLSKEEHKLIREVHPQVDHIRESLDGVIEKVEGNVEADPGSTR